MLTITSTRPMDCTVVLPMPTSTNHLFANASKGRVPSKEYKAWKTRAGWECKVQNARKLPGKFHMLLSLPVTIPVNADINNRDKAVLDLLKEMGLIAGDNSTYFTAYAVRMDHRVPPDKVRVDLWNVEDTA